MATKTEDTLLCTRPIQSARVSCCRWQFEAGKEAQLFPSSYREWMACTAIPYIYFLCRPNPPTSTRFQIKPSRGRDSTKNRQSWCDYWEFHEPTKQRRGKQQLGKKRLIFPPSFLRSALLPRQRSRMRRISGRWSGMNWERDMRCGSSVRNVDDDDQERPRFLSGPDSCSDGWERAEEGAKSSFRIPVAAFCVIKRKFVDAIVCAPSGSYTQQRDS